MKKLLSVFFAVIIAATLALVASCDMSDWSLGPNSSSGNETVETSSDTEPTKPIEQHIEEEGEVDENFEFLYLGNAAKEGWLTESDLLHISYYIYGKATKLTWDDKGSRQYESVKFTPTKEFVKLGKKQETAILDAYYGLRKGYFADGQGVEVLSVAKYCGKYNGIYVLKINDPTIVTAKNYNFTHDKIFLGDGTYLAAKPIDENVSKSADVAEKSVADKYEVFSIEEAYENGLITKESIKNLACYYVGEYFKKSDPEVTGDIVLRTYYKPTETFVPISKKEYDAITMACNAIDIYPEFYCGTFGGGYVIRKAGGFFLDTYIHFIDDIYFVSEYRNQIGLYFVKPIYEE